MKKTLSYDKLHKDNYSSQITFGSISDDLYKTTMD